MKMRTGHSGGAVVVESLEGRTFLSAAPTAAPAFVAVTPAHPAPYEQDLPWNITRVTDTGSRPVYSPDGSHIAYMRTIIGDAYELDLATGVSRNLTANAPIHYFTRVHYLPNGDYLLIGSKSADTVDTLDNDQQLWVLKKNGDGKPVPLGARCYDGVAVSTLTNTIAWGDNVLLSPNDFKPAPKSSTLNVAQVAYPNGVPTLVNHKVVLTRPSTFVNGQAFRNNDSEIIFVDYNGPIASVKGANIATGKITVYRSFSNEYNEAEGLFPDGQSILVESSRDKGAGHQTAQYIDIWKMPLIAGTTHFERLTRFGDAGAFKASNPVVSPDGRYIAFQSSVIGTHAGTGDGIFLYDTKTNPAGAKTVFLGDFQSGKAPNWVPATSATSAKIKFASHNTVISAGAGSKPTSVSITRTVNTSGFKDLSLHLQASQSGALFGASDFLKIEINDGAGWKRLFTDSGLFQGLDDATPEMPSARGNTTPTWTSYLALPTNAANKSNLQIRITCQVGTTGEQYILNQIAIVGTPTR